MSRRRSLPTEPVTTYIDNLSHDGRGIAHIDGKTTFIRGALPQETVSFQYTNQQSRFDEGKVLAVIEPSPQRVEPHCPHFGVCGGCNLQHLAPSAQIALKQDTLLNHFTHIGKVQPETIVPPLQADVWGYRRKARLGVKYVIKKQAVLVGFREQNSRFLAEITQCDVLHPSIGMKIMLLRDLISRLDAKEHIAQIEVAIDDEQAALVFRHLEPLTPSDQQILSEFAQANHLFIYLQSGGIKTIKPLYPENLSLASLKYHLPQEDLSFHFTPFDFTQVNTAINQQMVSQAMDWLSPQPTDHIIDLFCGLGNFTLPLAKRAFKVTGIEGDAELLNRAETNAQQQNINNIHYHIADLTKIHPQVTWVKAYYDKVLLDPPRSGALEVIRALSFKETQRIVYVSCNPATLARDAGELVHQKGFRLLKAGVMDMFPHTAHVESMALFTR